MNQQDNYSSSSSSSNYLFKVKLVLIQNKTVLVQAYVQTIYNIHLRMNINLFFLSDIEHIVFIFQFTSCSKNQNF